MTVCVAAICESNELILSASDSMMSWGPSISSETSHKYGRLHRYWGYMLAGDDIHPTEPMIRYIRGVLRNVVQPTKNDVEVAIRDAWRLVKNQRAVTHVLSQYDLTLEEFVRNGRDRFGEIGFAELRAAIDQASQLACELLIYGFDYSDRPCLYVVVHPGEPVEFSRLGFAAIGSGRDSAISSLMSIPPHRMHDGTDRGFYRVCAAKFSAETALGVGDETVVVGIRKNGTAFVANRGPVEQVRKIWERYGRPRKPPNRKLVELGSDVIDVDEINDPSTAPTLSDPKRDPKALPPSPE